MKVKASDVTGYGIEARDGPMGSIVDLLFDDEAWTLRWLVIDTGLWLSGRQVLLPPSCIERIDTMSRRVRVGLVQQQVKGSPGLESDAPVSRQKETEIYDYYAWPPYWVGGLGYGGTGSAIGRPAAYRPIVPPLNETGSTVPSTEGGARAPFEKEAAERTFHNENREEGDHHLRSIGQVTGLSIYATDGSMGHVEDFILDDEDWAIRYLIVDTVNWWPGKKVLIATDWIAGISWVNRNVSVELTRDQLKNSPEYQPEEDVGRGYEHRLYAHYQRPPYWL